VEMVVEEDNKEVAAVVTFQEEVTTTNLEL